MIIDIYRVDEVPADVQAAWAAGRQAQDPYSLFTGGYDWFRMMTAANPDVAKVVVGRWDDGEIRQIIPLQPWPKKIGWRTIRTLKVVGGEPVAPVSSRRPADGDEFWSEVLARFPNDDGLWFGHVTVARPFEMAGRGTFVHTLFCGLPHYRLVLPPTLDELWSRRSKGSIKKIFGRERAMARDHGKEVRLVELRSSADAAPYRVGIESLMRGTWQARELGHGFDATGLDQLATWGWLRSFVLLLGDETVAYAHGYQGAGVYVYAQIGFAESYKSYSPGTILLYRLLEYFYSAPDRPICVDFGEGEADYKHHLANDRQEVSSVLLLRDRAMLRLMLRGCLVAGQLAGGLRRVARSLSHEKPVQKN